MSRHFVMVVEDDLEIREALMDSLTDSGWEAIGAPNGAAALQYLASTDRLPCLVLLDLMMPVMDGQAFREAQLRDDRLAHIPNRRPLCLPGRSGARETPEGRGGAHEAPEARGRDGGGGAALLGGP